MQRKLDKPFMAEISYQPLNGMYGCKIEEGNTTIFEVDENITICVDKVVRRYMEI